jgi:3-deoxy-D-arabino-heptulosonate 7-phosphate (DAHP) synthase
MSLAITNGVMDSTMKSDMLKIITQVYEIFTLNKVPQNSQPVLLCKCLHQSCIPKLLSCNFYVVSVGNDTAICERLAVKWSVHVHIEFKFKKIYYSQSIIVPRPT